MTNAALVARRTFRRRVRGDFRQEQGISLAEPIVDLPNRVSLVAEVRNDSGKLRAAQTKNLHDLVAAELAATDQVEPSEDQKVGTPRRTLGLRARRTAAA